MTSAPHPLFSRLSALVIDDQSAMRSLHKNQLQDIGLSEIDLASGPNDALALIRSKHFDLILCDHDLRSHTDGQQLLELLRNENCLPAATIFVMITGNSFKGDVAAASEHVPDDYILKPITVRGLEDRLVAILKRRATLNPVLQLIRERDFEAAVRLCDELLLSKSDYPSELQRRKAESLIEMGKFAAARQVYEEVGKVSSKLVWAKMGEARACYLDGQADAARALLKSLVAGNDQNMAAQEFLAKIAEESGNLDEALQVLTDAAARVGSARRHRALGHMAMRTGRLDVARDSLKMAVKLSRGSAAAQSDDALALAQVHVDLGEPKAAHQVLDDTAASVRNDPAARSALSALRSQAFREQGEHAAAEKMLKQALDEVQVQADLASLLVAKAALRAGDPALAAQGVQLLARAVQEDHENARMVDLARQALVATGNQALVADTIDAPTEGLKAQIARAKSMLRDRAFAQAVEQLDALLDQYASNTAVLLETARAYLLEMSFNGIAAEKLKRVQQLLAKLDRLMPQSEKVQLLHHFLVRVKSKEAKARST